MQLNSKSRKLEQDALPGECEDELKSANELSLQPQPPAPFYPQMKHAM